MDYIKVRGARQHNLKNISVDIPKNKFVVITGVSGSGKSSLAFDTIYAEGQRRYVESLSAYARQFLGVMDKPDVDAIDGLSPSISIDQKTVSHNPRSTVGTITEVYDYLRLLFARVGRPHCHHCGTEIVKLSLDEIVGRILQIMEKNAAGGQSKSVRQYAVLSPIIRQKKGEFRDLLDNVRAKGFTRVRIDGVERDLAEEISLPKTFKHDIHVVIDSLPVGATDFRDKVFHANLRSRLTNAVEQSINLSAGLVTLQTPDGERLFSEKLSCPACGLSLPEIEPRTFSFNSPLGACTTCRGIGTLYKIEPDLILNKNLSVNEGGLIPFARYFFYDTWYARLLKQVAAEENIDLRIPLGKLAPEKLSLLLYGTNRTHLVTGANRQGRQTSIQEYFDGIVKELERRYADHTAERAGLEIQKFMREEVCVACRGAKLKPEVLAITVDGRNIAALSNLAITDLADYCQIKLSAKLNAYELQIAKPILKEVQTRLTFLHNVGLGYLTVSRTAKTLSGGELQRIRLASQIGSGLTGVLYVLDEPSIGLHPRDVAALIATLHELKNLGNTLLIVEHDPETITSAEYIVELGPLAGAAGGHITFTGTVAAMKKSTASLTGQFLSGKKSISWSNTPPVTNRGKLLLTGASEHNLKNINLEIPLGNLVAVTGVSGSGKSTLVVDTLYPALKYYLDGYFPDKIGALRDLRGSSHLDRVYLIDQSPIGRTPRSNPSTYVGFFDDIRELFAQTIEAKARGFTKSRFSFNLKGGRCEKCQGAGVIKIEMQFLPDVLVACDVCAQRRYNRETLEIKYKDKYIDEILNMTVETAADFFKSHPPIFLKLSFLKSVGLGYIKLGQPAPTFSGGEAQRLKLANELSRRDSGKTLYVLDEPTTGLHFFDIDKLLAALHQLVARGNTVIVIEHNLDIIKNCQYVIDLGPEGGEAGGRLVYQGELAGLLRQKKSHTAAYLKRYL